jgi:uncharacterized protein YndB with AHSA1/START domain
MKIVRTTIINAKPEHVFAAITGFKAYSQWNPWLVKAEGECQTGEDIVVDVVFGKRIQQYHHKILKIDRPNVFHWCDKGWFTIFAYGDRLRTCVPVAGGTEYTVVLSITGPLSFLVEWLFGEHLAEGMTRETAALKQFVEQSLQA